MTKETYQEQIKRLKTELALFLEVAERLNFSKKEIEKQVDVYLDSINKLNEKRSKSKD